MGESRYAVYAAPRPGSALARAAEAWFSDDSRAALVETPRRYGFHATLKAPFRLREGASRDTLMAAVSRLAANRVALRGIRLEVSALGAFAALVPAPDQTQDGIERALAALADLCLRELDGFRAPLTPAEYARRDPDRLSPRQRDNLERWGYPHVLDDFRFHMTLTGPLEPAAMAQAQTMATGVFANARARIFDLEDICLFEEPAPGAPFALVQRTPLGAARPTSVSTKV